MLRRATCAVGPPLPNRQERKERLTALTALAILGADAIASSVYGPEEMLDFVERSEAECFITVIVPEVLPTRWWHPLVHNYFAWRLKWILLFRQRRQSRVCRTRSETRRQPHFVLWRTCT